MMRTFAARRWTLATAALLAATVILTVLLAYHLRLHATAFGSGWLLLTMILFLAAYNLRKKLRLFPLLPNAWWVQAHIYVGLVAVLVFAWHTGLRAPGGPLEILLWAAYLVATASGIIGLWLSRTVPPRLTMRGQEIIYDRIPAARRELKQRAEQLAFRAIEQSRSTALADFYEQHLVAYFTGAADRIAHMLQSRRPLHDRLRRLENLRRYVDEKDAPLIDELEQMVQTKDALDYHHAMQGVLRAWLFVHVPTTAVLLLFIAIHVVVVHAFSGAL